VSSPLRRAQSIDATAVGKIAAVAADFMQGFLGLANEDAYELAAKFIQSRCRSNISDPVSTDSGVSLVAL